MLQKAQGTLEKRLAPQGVAVKWVEFPAGPQLLEGLNVGAIDVGFVGEAPPIFAQAAGARFVYVGNDPAAPTAEALVVPKESPLKSVADLKGKRIALNKGSNVHYLLVKLLEKNGLKYSDITPVFLPPADARAAFEKGAVDAWAIWDPFLAAVGAADRRAPARRRHRRRQRLQLLPGADRLRAGQPGRHPRAVRQHAGGRAGSCRPTCTRAAALIAPLQGLDAAVVETSLKRYRFGVAPLTPAVAAEQQKVADTFFDLKLIPKAVRIADALPAGAAAATIAGK